RLPPSPPEGEAAVHQDRRLVPCLGEIRSHSCQASDALQVETELDRRALRISNGGFKRLPDQVVILYAYLVNIPLEGERPVLWGPLSGVHHLARDRLRVDPRILVGDELRLDPYPERI